MKNILFTSNKVHTTARIGVLFFSLCFSPLINAGNAEKPMNGIESSETTQQNKIKITGVVTDSKGESIIGANVVVKGQSNVGAITDVEGRYQIMVPSDNAILQVSYLGYVTEEIKVKGRRNINVMLNEDSKALDEVVVVGYGQQKKESVVVSMSSIKPKDIVVPSRSLNNSLAGQVAGLIAVQRSGEPGYDNAEFWIRGVSTFAGGTSPLVLVDGVPRSIAAASVNAAARPKGLCIKTPILSSSSLRQSFFCPVFYIIRLFIRIVDMSARFSTKNLLFVENSRFCIIL